MGKACSVCRVFKPYEEFGVRKAMSDGRRSECRACVNEAWKRYREKNHEKFVASQRDYYARNREKRIASAQEWRRLNPEKAAAASARSQRLNWHTQAFHSMRRKECDVSANELLEMFEKQNGLCYWLGIPMVPSDVKRDPRRPSVDRLDPSRGYVRGNIVLTCQFANMGRSTLAAEDFRAFVAELRSHFAQAT